MFGFTTVLKTKIKIKLCDTRLFILNLRNIIILQHSVHKCKILLNYILLTCHIKVYSLLSTSADDKLIYKIMISFWNYHLVTKLYQIILLSCSNASRLGIQGNQSSIFFCNISFVIYMAFHQVSSC